MPDNRVAVARNTFAPAPSPGAEPKQMTWLKALPLLAITAVFDLVRAFFELFWLFGPALTGTALGVWLSQYIGDALAGIVGAGVAIGAGVFAGEYFEMIGVAVAMIVGIAGLLMLGGILLTFNPRIFKTDAAYLVRILITFIVGETPVLGAVPVLTFTTYRMYRIQIKKERATHRAWAERVQAAAAAVQEENQAFAYQMRLARLRQQAANDNETLAADNAIPEELAAAA